VIGFFYSLFHHIYQFLRWPGTGGMAPEAPHMYKKDGHYYLMIAEGLQKLLPQTAVSEEVCKLTHFLISGGTEFGHCATIARAPTVWGPFESNPANPVARAASRSSLFQTVGHADLFQGPDGAWHAVMLASRVFDGRFPMGRESVLLDVDWSGEWPVFDLSAIDVPAVMPPSSEPASAPGKDVDVLSVPEFAFVHLRVPAPDTLTIRADERTRVVRANGVTLTDPLGAPAFIGVRQRHVCFSSTVTLSAPAADNAIETGYALYLDHERHLAVTVTNGQVYLVRKQPDEGQDESDKSRAAAVSLPAGTEEIRIRITGTHERYEFAIAAGRGVEWQTLGEADTKDVSIGFTGAILAVFATAKAASDETAAVPEVEIREWHYQRTGPM
jgi:xylan 1,4-beta-xylosidase